MLPFSSCLEGVKQIAVIPLALQLQHLWKTRSLNLKLTSSSLRQLVIASHNARTVSASMGGKCQGANRELCNEVTGVFFEVVLSFVVSSGRLHPPEDNPNVERLFVDR